MVGQRLTCRVIELDKRANRLVLSRREVMEEERHRERVALLETLDVADEQKRAVLDALVAALRERGVAALVAPLAQNDALRSDRKWDAVIGVADLDGGARFAHRLNI